MSERRRAWILNLDAEHELEATRSYAPTRHLAEIVLRESRQLVGRLTAPGDVVLTEADVEQRTAAARAARGCLGVAWCPTPRALRMLAAVGAEATRAPAVGVLRTVNARPFAAAVRAPLVGRSFEKHVAASIDEVLSLVTRPADDGWLVRRTFGAAGRGRRRLAAGKPSESERLWLAASLRFGPLVVEPWVRIVREYTRSGFVAEDGTITVSRPCFQETTPHGAWTRTQCFGAGELERSDDERLAATMHVAGSALARAGYFGPYGIDAYRHRALDGSRATVLNPLSEINARFTMDWATAFAPDPGLGVAHARAASLVDTSGA